MKIGTQTASLVNHLQARAVNGQPEPTVGMGATILHWTDRSPGTIVKVFHIGGSWALQVQADHYTRADSNGLSECQTYEYSPNPEGALYTFRQAKDGRWEEVSCNPETKRWKKTGGAGLRIGERNRYHDFSF